MLAAACQPEGDKDLRRDPCAGIEHPVWPAPRARWQEALMPLVEAGDQRRSQYCDAGPAKSPFCMRHGGQGLPPGPEQEDAQQAIAEDMPSFTDEEMPILKLITVESKQEMKKRVENV